jgi:hypothetical protein
MAQFITALEKIGVNANVVIGFPAIALVEGKHAGSRINIS